MVNRGRLNSILRLLGLDLLPADDVLDCKQEENESSAYHFDWESFPFLQHWLNLYSFIHGCLLVVVWQCLRVISQGEWPYPTNVPINRKSLRMWECFFWVRCRLQDHLSHTNFSIHEAIIGMHGFIMPLVWPQGLEGGKICGIWFQRSLFYCYVCTWFMSIEGWVCKL